MEGASAYRIKGWDTSGFEVAQNSRTRGPLKWVALPTKHDGKGFRRLMKHQEGAAFFGCWCLLVQVAAKCPTRGVLADDDGPLSSSDLHLKTGAPEAVMEQAINYLHSEVGWLELVDISSPRPPTDEQSEKETGPAMEIDTLQQSVAACNKVLPTKRDVRNETERNETEQEGARARGDPFDRADDIALPKNLDEAKAFRAAWSDWLRYRRERRASMRTMTIERQLAMLSRLGVERACESIDNSIRNDWVGLFEPKERDNGRAGQPHRGHDATRVKSERTDSDFSAIPVVQRVGGEPSGTS